MRGRKPKPTAKKRLEGNPGKRQINKREPKPKAAAKTLPDRPIELMNVQDGQAIDAMIKRFTEIYFQQLQKLEILTDIDHAAFELMSVHYALAWVATAVVQREGLQKLSVMGGYKKHPLLQVVRENSMAFRGYAAEFGMTPSARSRIQVPLPGGNTQLEMELFGDLTQVAK
jgi:P27 family predicted phage terminase small subunit